MRVVVLEIGRKLLTGLGEVVSLPRGTTGERHWSQSSLELRNGHTYPSKIEGHYEYEVGGEYDHEVIRRIHRDGVQNGRNIEPPHSRLSCLQNNHQEREDI
jgi:hypothetical protein